MSTHTYYVFLEVAFSVMEEESWFWCLPELIILELFSPAVCVPLKTPMSASTILNTYYIPGGVLGVQSILTNETEHWKWNFDWGTFGSCFLRFFFFVDLLLILNLSKFVIFHIHILTTFILNHTFMIILLLLLNKTFLIWMYDLHLM